ncbi:MAG: TonB-dependent receptor [Roseateles sp.]|uniref:TonB-dependent receptor n=1 Tax=Roseateles sp. TaxID=1971397 RepID=UPI0039EB6681
MNPRSFPRPNTRLHALAAAALLAAGPAAFAQQAAAPAEAASATKLDAVVVTGIRASIAKSIATKRNASTNVEVVSAEDVGKMPDKNVADALSRLPGVNVQYGGAGAMDEAERVAIRGTSPGLNLVTIAGHAVSAGDWHVGDQSAGNTVSSRSVGFGLLPSQLIGQTLVYKTQRADITEGGLAGSVDVLLRRPLDFKTGLSGEAALGAVYADLPGKTDPQVSGLMAWVSQDRRIGLVAQAFKEDRTLRRDGQELFSYTALTQAQATSLAGGDAALAAQLVGKRLPNQFNSAMFEGVRKRKGGYLGLELRPDAQWDIVLSGFKSSLDAPNYNSSGFATLSNLVPGGWLLSNPVIDGDVITGASLKRPAGSTTNAMGMEFDHFMRAGARSTSDFYDLDVKFEPSDRLSLRARAGSTEGGGYTSSQPALVFALVNPDITYQMHRDRATDWVMTNAAGQRIDLGNIANYEMMNGLPLPAVTSLDRENYLHFDGDLKLATSWFTNLKFGLRTATHKRSVDAVGSRWNAQDDGSTATPFRAITGASLINFPVTTPNPATAYPGGFASGVDGDFPRDLFRFGTDQLQQFADQYQYYDATGGKQWGSGYALREKNRAAYLMGEFDAEQFSGNIGLRAVQTVVDTTSYQLVPQCPALAACPTQGAIVGSRFGTVVPSYTSTKHNALLPSANLKWDIDSRLVARFSLSRSLGRPNYNELAGALTVNNNTLIAATGNPMLKPTTANNADASLAWYFAPRAYVSGSLFSQRLHDYVKPVSQVAMLDDPSNPGTQREYMLTTRVGMKAKLHGAELAAELPLGAGFGAGGNLTYVKSRDADGQPMLGSSKVTYNLIGFYENDRFSARLSWNWRDDYAYTVIGDGSGQVKQDLKGNYLINGLHYYAAYGALSLSLNYKINEHLSVSLDGNNLNDPLRHTYMLTESAPANWYTSGRQYYLNLRMKL